MEYKDVFTKIYDTFGFGSTESRSGNGSELSRTVLLREKLKELIVEKGIKSIVDIPCGDFHWMKEIVFNFEYYTGGDIVPSCIKDNNERYSNSRIKFIEHDILKDEIPTGDVLLVRDIIGHFPLEDGIKIVDNILRSKCKYLLSTTWYNIEDEAYSEIHDNNGAEEYGKFYAVNLMSEPFYFPKPDMWIEEPVHVGGHEYGVRKVLGLWELDKVREHLYELKSKVKTNNKKVTIVTALWDLGRGEIGEGFKRGYPEYLENFKELLKTDACMFIYVDPKDEEFIWKHRKRSNTVVRTVSLDELKSWFEFSDITNSIRQKEEWLGQAGWLPESPQAKLEMYNPVVMSKMFMLNDVSIFNPFKSEYYFWIDAGICNTVHSGYFYHDKVFNNLPYYCSQTKDFIFISYPYIGGEEIHGFPRKDMARYCGAEYVEYVCRGGFFGGKKEAVNSISSMYYGYLKDTLGQGLMGTEESIFTIIAHNYPDEINRFVIEDTGLIWPFFEQLKEYIEPVDSREVALYILTYNSPKQLRELLKSFVSYDINFIHKTKKYLLNNSTDRDTDEEYALICREYDLNEIKKDNIGICGGRQFIAEHFATTPYEYCMFFEDDMNFYTGDQNFCRNGFNRKIDNLFNKVVDIIKKERFDFLKFNFSEFFGDNSTQWAWYNVPQDLRQKHWPDNFRLPEHGLSPNAPKTIFNMIKSYSEVPYATGEIFYSNWPQIVSKSGNMKMFLETKWEYPYEQTWMSFMFQKTLDGFLRPGILLVTPTEHHRFDHYSTQRKEH